MSDTTFPAVFRLKTTSQFDAVYQTQVYAADGTLVINGMRNGLTFTRLGLSISRKHGNAVMRNRWKRLIREAFRRVLEELPPGFDLVIRPKQHAIPNYAAVLHSIPALTQRLLRKFPQD